ncbi:MAG: LPD38 domain-containing protein, partial [Bacteroidota bacterium]|nr:LPD38 domain-containing protein [Bacteroidota bacterium]
TEKEAGLAKTIFRPSQFKPKGDIIEYFEVGKRRYIEVSKNLYNAMTGLNETGSGLMVKILSVPAHTLRTGATITPEFMARNFIRDQFTGFIQTRFGFKPFVDSAEGIAAIMGKTEIYYDWMRSGGAYSGIVELSRTNLKKTLMELRGQKNLLKRLNIISHAQDISQLFEQATRIGAYKAAKRTGLSDIEAGFESRESTLDFARKGARTKDVNAVIAFFNAGIQAADKSVRVAKEDPLGFATKCVASITVPSVISYLANRNNPEYRELPRWQKDLFWMFQLGDTWVRIPKPFAYGQIFGSIPERFMEYFDSKDPEAFEGLGESVMESLSPVGTDIASAIIPTGLQPLIENATNWNFFLKRNIVPPYQARLLPAEQYKKYTSETAKGIGRVLNTSPAKIENITRGWFGGTGGYALEAGDVFLNAIKKLKGEELEPERPPEPADYPLIRGFTARPAYSGTSQSVQDFYNKTRKINQEYNTYVKLLKEGKKAEAEKLKEKYPEWRYAKVLNRYSDAMSRVSQQIDKIIQSDYTVEQKRELINKYEKLRVGMAQAANEFLKKQSTQKKKVIPNLFE